MSAPLLLSIDQGTTSSRAMLFERDGSTFAVAQREFTSTTPTRAGSSTIPEEIWETTLAVCREALKKADEAGRSVAGIGITNQRETTLVWERDTGKAVHRAIVWQDRRTGERCRELRDAGHADAVTATTGLLLDPYFSGTKIGWILDHVDGARTRAERGELVFGTVDTFPLIWRLTGGRAHVTDTTNACRTLLFDIRENAWDERMCRLLDVPTAMLPEVPRLRVGFRHDGRGRARRRAPDRGRRGGPARRPRSARSASAKAWSRAPTGRAASWC